MAQELILSQKKVFFFSLLSDTSQTSMTSNCSKHYQIVNIQTDIKFDYKYNTTSKNNSDKFY